MISRGELSWWCLAFLVTATHALDDLSGVAAAAAAPETLIAPQSTPWYIYIFSWQFICGAFLMASPITSYGDTVYTIWKTKSSAGFSLDLCGIMLVSSILRVAFYFGEPYEASLLWQAIIMIAIQVVLLHLALKYRPAGGIGQTNVFDVSDNIFSSSLATASEPFTRGRTSLLDVDPAKAQLSMNSGSAASTSPRRKSVSEVVHNLRPAKSVSVLRSLPEESSNASSGISMQTLSARIVPLARKVSRAIRTSAASSSPASFSSPAGYGSRPFHLWQWDSDVVYWKFLVLLSAALALLHALVGKVWLYIQFIGFAGLFIEAVLPVPQILTNAELQSVQGFRLSLMGSWLAGDISKLTYFRYGAENLAPQFIICTVVRLGLDLFVGVQYVFYGMLLPSMKAMRPGATAAGEYVGADGKIIELRPGAPAFSELHLSPVAEQAPVPTVDTPVNATRQRSHSIKQPASSLA